MLLLLAASFGMAVASALIPIIVLEVYVLGLVLARPDMPWWAVGLVIAIGQVVGKLLYFYAGRGDIKLPTFLRREKKEKKPGRWAKYLVQFRELCDRRPGWSYSIMLLSATASVPPYAAIAVIAGVGKVSLLNFVSACFIGRFVRFAALAAAPVLVSGWLNLQAAEASLATSYQWLTSLF